MHRNTSRFYTAKHARGVALEPNTYWGFHFDVNAIGQLRGSRGWTWVEASLRCLYNRDNAVHQHV